MKAKIIAGILDEYLSVPLSLDLARNLVTIDAYTDGLYIKTMDCEHVALIEAKLPATAFVDGEYQSEGLRAAYDLEKIKSIINLARPDEVIGLETICNDSSLNLNIQNLTRKCKLYPAESESKIQLKHIPAYAILPVDDIKRVCNSIYYSDNSSGLGLINLFLTPEEFILSSESETDKIELKLALKDYSTDYKCTEKVHSMFAIDYFAAMMDTVHSDKIKLSLSTNYPVLAEWESRSGSVKYVIAPRIENK